MMLQNLITFLVGFTGNIMVGSLGEAAISGVFIGNQPQSLLQTVVIGMDSAMLVLAAQYWGRRDVASIKKIFNTSVRVAMGLGLIFTVAVLAAPEQILRIFTKDASAIGEGVKYVKYVAWSYLFFVGSQSLITVMRSVESVKIGMFSSSAALIVNISLNYILIFGKLGAPAMGVAGTAVATLIARVVEFAVVFVFVFFVDKKLHLRFGDMLKTDKLLSRDFVRYGTPIIGGQVVWGLNTAVQSAIIGSMGTNATSAASMYGMSFQLFGVIMFALSAAVGITTGKLVGSGEVERVKNHARFVQVMYLGIGILCMIIILLLKSSIISLYNITEETARLANQFLTIFAVLFVGTCYQGFSLGSLVKPGGDTKFVFINDSIFVWCIVIPSALIALKVFNAPPWVVFLCLKSDEILKCPVAFFKINSFNWIKNLTRETAPEEVEGAPAAQ